MSFPAGKKSIPNLQSALPEELSVTLEEPKTATQDMTQPLRASWTHLRSGAPPKSQELKRDLKSDLARACARVTFDTRALARARAAARRAHCAGSRDQFSSPRNSRFMPTSAENSQSAANGLRLSRVIGSGRSANALLGTKLLAERPQSQYSSHRSGSTARL
jgi:hypothetical protein